MPIPTTIEEAMQALLHELSYDEQIDIAQMTEEQVGHLHHSLGQWMRNNWGLWQGGPLLDHMKSLGFIHPDDMSASLIREFWARMNKLPSKIPQEIEYYRQYWERN